MKIEYDAQVDIMYIKLREATSRRAMRQQTALSSTMTNT